MTKKLLDRAFRHGLTVGMHLGHNANDPFVMELYRAGTLPRTVKALNALEDSIRAERKRKRKLARGW